MTRRQRIDLDVITLERRNVDPPAAAPRLRFDQVATRFLDRLKGSADRWVPEGMMVLVTVTAPIRLPAKTAAALDQRMAVLLRRRPPVRPHKAVIHGNRVQMLVLPQAPPRTPKMLGFVHNDDDDPPQLFAMTRELLKLIGPAVSRPDSVNADRWLLLITSAAVSCLPVYRYLMSQLPMATGFNRVLMGFPDGNVAPLKIYTGVNTTTGI